MVELLKKAFPELHEPELLSALEDKSSLHQVPAGAELMHIGSYIKVIPLVTEGTLKVLRDDDQGGELLLYYIHPGQSCAMTLNCCLSNLPSEVRAVAEEDSNFIAVPADMMDDLMRFTSWKNFVMQTYRSRFNELLEAVDSIAFMQLDQRLVKYLEEKAEAQGSRELQATHQEVAADLHSSREVVSRLLKQLERKGTIRLGRNRIKLL